MNEALPICALVKAVLCKPVFPDRDALKEELPDREVESMALPECVPEKVERAIELPPNLPLLKDAPVVWELAIFDAARLAEMAELFPRDIVAILFDALLLAALGALVILLCGALELMLGACEFVAAPAPAGPP